MVQPRYPKPKLKCHRKGKLIYIDEKHARQAVRRLQKEPRNKNILLRYYICPHCNHYHITKTESFVTPLELNFDSN